MVVFASTEDAIRELNGQTAKIAWAELARFFAAGKVIYVNEGLDLVDVGAALIMDQTATFEDWIAKGQIHPVNDKQAKEWIENDLFVWACAVSPWVLVQPISSPA